MRSRQYWIQRTPTPADGWESQRPLDSLGFVGIWGPPADPWQAGKCEGRGFFLMANLDLFRCESRK